MTKSEKFQEVQLGPVEATMWSVVPGKNKKQKKCGFARRLL